MSLNNRVGLLGVGHYLPTNHVPNQHFVDRGLDTTPEWIETRSGIYNRHIADANETTSMMATYAAKAAIEDAGVSLEAIDFIIIATATPDHYGFPSTACLVQHQLQLTRQIPCFDITAACSGFTYGLGIANGYIQTGIGKTGLVIGAEKLSNNVNWADRRSAILFGDGAGAAVVGSVSTGGFLAFDQGADGSSSEILKCTPLANIEAFDGQVQPGNTATIEMDGQAVFKKGIDVVVKSIRSLLDRESLALEDIDYFVCHQANARILDRVAKSLRVSAERFLTNIDQVGNTSAASIPLVLSEFSERDHFKTGDKLCLVGFGAGFTWSSIIIEWSKS